MSLLTENNQQYYVGSQSYLSTTGAAFETFKTTFNTDLVLKDYDPLNTDYVLNNFKLFTAAAGDFSYVEYTAAYTVVNNVITITAAIAANTSVVVQLKTENGGNYGQKDAFGDVVQDNWGSYAYVKLDDIVNNFLVAYVGNGKLIPNVKRTDLVFFAKRALQEFSYDTLKSIKSQELNVPPSLSVPIPQDFVNYVRMSWVDTSGIKHIIHPTALTSNPYRNPIQDTRGIPVQDNFGNNTEGTSLTEERWDINGMKIPKANSQGGELYNMNTGVNQGNGWFTFNERKNTISFSNDLVQRLIILEYVSDGLSSDMDTKIPKMAEEAMYAYMSHAILATRSNQPEYVINRLNREKVAKLRNAKIRLSNIKIEEIAQVMRGKSKWIKS